jgi:hypothetical protein
MEYFAGLDVSMAETHVRVMHRDGAIVHEVTLMLHSSPCRPIGRSSAGDIHSITSSAGRRAMAT